MSSIRPWKRGTEAQRAANNTVPLGGEIGVDTDTGRIVVSDGVTSWAGLSPAIRVTELNAFAASVSGTYAPVPSIGATLLNELLGHDPAQANGVRWFTAQESVARAVGWAIVTDPQWAGGADPTGTADSTAAIAAANASLAVAGRGVLWFPPGVYLSGLQTVYSLVQWRGSGYETTILQLKNGANSDLLQGNDYQSLTGGSSGLGIVQWSISDMTLDGNKTEQTGTSNGIRQFGYGFTLTNLRIRNFLTKGIRSEWSSETLDTPGYDSMEAQLVNVKVHDCGGHGIDWQGPHDTQFVNVIPYLNGADGFHMNATFSMVNCHTWGNFNIPLYIDSNALSSNAAGCIAEGAGTGASDHTIPQVFVGASDFSWVGGNVYNNTGGTVSSGLVGFQIGDITHQGIAGTEVRTKIGGCSVAAFNFEYDAFGVYESIIYGAGPAYIGTPNAHSQLNLVNYDSLGNSIVKFPYAPVQGATNILDDANGKAFFKQMTVGTTDLTQPPFGMAAAPAAQINWGGFLGFGLDSNFAWAFNGGGAGMYYMNAGVKGNTLDDGAGNGIVKTALTVAGADTIGKGRLAQIYYAPSAYTLKQNTTATEVVLDATNLAITFTVPPSGIVDVRLSALCGADGSVDATWGLIEGASTVMGQAIAGFYASASTVDIRTVCDIKVTGLTPGSSHTWKWAHMNGQGNGHNIRTIYGGGTNINPAIMEVWAG